MTQPPSIASNARCHELASERSSNATLFAFVQAKPTQQRLSMLGSTGSSAWKPLVKLESPSANLSLVA